MQIIRGELADEASCGLDFLDVFFTGLKEIWLRKSLAKKETQSDKHQKVWFVFEVINHSYNFSCGTEAKHILFPNEFSLKAC